MGIIFNFYFIHYIFFSYLISGSINPITICSSCLIDNMLWLLSVELVNLVTLDGLDDVIEWIKRDVLFEGI